MKRIRGYSWRIDAAKIDVAGADFGFAIDDFLTELVPTVSVYGAFDGSDFFCPSDRRSKRFEHKFTLAPGGRIWKKNGESLWPESCSNYGAITLRDVIKRELDEDNFSSRDDLLTTASELESLAAMIRKHAEKVAE